MPELPEVENVVRDLSDKILYRKISVIKSHTIKLRNIIDSSLFNAVYNKKIIKIERIAKYIVFTLADSIMQIIIHLGMTGKLILTSDINLIHDKHSHILFDFIDLKNQKLVFNDIRKFGVFKITDDFINNDGIDPTYAIFTMDNFHKLCEKNKQRNIKNFLMDSKQICGIGNIYAAEILFDAKIMPTLNLKDLSLKRRQNLYFSIKNILNKAIENKGTSIKDYRLTDNQQGNFQNYLKVYNQQKCLICNYQISKLKQNGRTTFFCINCQR